MDLSKVEISPISATLDKYNIQIKENHGLNSNSGFWWFVFTFDYELEVGIEVRLTNFKYDSSSNIWTLEITKCNYLGISNKEEMASFDMEDELIYEEELRRLNQAVNAEKLRDYLKDNIIPIVIQKIKYTRFSPQFRFFLSHKSKDKPLMRTFRSGLKFLGYKTWLDETDIPIGANLQGTLKVNIDKCDCLIAWLNKEYFESDYCKAELLYARSPNHKQKKIILPFGKYSEFKEYLTGDLEFLKDLLVFDPSKKSFFEILRSIDQALFKFETLTI